MRTLAALAVVVLAGGCNALLGLDPPGAARDGGGDGDGAIDDGGDGDGSGGDDRDGPAAIDAPACATANHDEDVDGADDACDSCPHVATAGGVDGDDDGDGVGNACDPHAGVIDRIAEFRPLIGEALIWTPVRGSWSLNENGLHQGDQLAQGLVMLGTSYSGPATFEVGVRIDAVTGIPGEGFSLWFEATAKGATVEPDGYQTTIGAGGAGGYLALTRWINQEDALLGQVSLGGTYVAGARFRVRAERASQQLSAKAVQLPSTTGPTLLNADFTYNGGQLGFATSSTAITVEYVVVYVPG